MNRTSIEWTDYTWNPITGCSRLCDYCYAKRIAVRLAGRFGYPKDDPFKVTFHPNRLSQPREVSKPSKIFTCSMGELFDPKSRYGWIGFIFAEMKRNPQHTFQVLTKRHEVLDQFEYPENLLLGVTVDGRGLDKNTAIDNLRFIECSNVKFVSFEPLLFEVAPDLKGIDWIIIGAKTGSKGWVPPKEWVETLTHIARLNNCAVFHKDNLGYGWLKEFPKERLK